MRPDGPGFFKQIAKQGYQHHSTIYLEALESLPIHVAQEVCRVRRRVPPVTEKFGLNRKHVHDLNASRLHAHKCSIRDPLVEGTTGLDVDGDVVAFRAHRKRKLGDAWMYGQFETRHVSE